MNFIVDWEDDARDDLAIAWMAASTLERNAITVAQDHIDRLLATNPQGNGWPLSEGLFATEFPPLRVLYEIFDDVHKVKVVAMNLVS